MRTDLPAGGSSRLMETIRDLGWRASVSLLGASIGGQFSFPIELWNVEQQAWDAPIEKIDSWLVQLDHELEVEAGGAATSRTFSQYEY